MSREDRILDELRATITLPLSVEDVPRLTPVAWKPELRHPLDVSFRRSASAVVSLRRSWWRSAFGLVPWLIGASIVILGLLYVSQYGSQTKAEVMQTGGAAVAHMLAANDHAQSMDWESVGKELMQARDGFDVARQELTVLGPAITAALARIPGLGALGVGQKLLTAGQLLSEAGLSVSDAIGTLTDVQSSASGQGVKGVSFGQAFPVLAQALSTADAKVGQAAELLEGINEKNIPDEFRDQFQTLRERLPEVRALVSDGAGAVTFLQRFMGDDQPRRYLVLFQNSSELRPTGGFPGSYGLLTLQSGKVTDWRADDIYNPDGQIKNLIVPPLQLQHITPGWGMRDANWFTDFTVSAPKVVELYRQGGGTAVDGVIAIRPDVLGMLLRATGGIALDGYDKVITADNFLPILQSQVEEDRPTGAPKRIIGDLAPVVLDRLAALPAAQWMTLVSGFADALNRRDVLAWFSDAPLQAYVDAHAWSGRVGAPDGDYLMTVISNIAGAKTDAVTATSLKLETRMQDGTLVHRLSITRRNDGNASPYGFYNKTNRAYIRVLVPEGSTLRGIDGNARTAYRPLMDYAQVTAVRDPVLTALEATYQHDARTNTTTFEESGRAGFGFWMEVEPGATKTVQLEYAVPAAAAGNPYHLYVQRQPGLDVANFELTFEKPGLMVADSTPSLVEWPDSWRLHSTLERDLQVTANLR